MGFEEVESGIPGITVQQENNISIGAEEIENRFGFHKATIEGQNATLPMHAELRIAIREFAEYLDYLLVPGRAKEIAFERLEDASMWSHKAIAELSPLIDDVVPNEEN